MKPYALKNSKKISKESCSKDRKYSLYVACIQLGTKAWLLPGKSLDIKKTMLILGK